MMRASDPLVSTRLRPPEARANLVARPRLTAMLQREAGRKLTLVSAPAGFGKTTLLVAWLRSRAPGAGSVAWLSLEEGDNDPARLLSYLVAALRSISGEIGEGVLSSLRSPEPPQLGALTAALINEISSLSTEITLVLDDYHLIDSEAVHGVVSFLLEHLPPNVHLVISSRVNPPLPLGRLRARGQMAELRAANLRFTSEEAAAFLGDVMGLALSAGDVVALEGRTEGWIAGLQLAALSMRDRKDVSGFVRAFSGSHRDVLDYLAEEVLERQPESMRKFLLETSILDYLSGSLCDALTGRSDGQEILERLERDNLFVVALDDERRWYRYHHLFADFLKARLEREGLEHIPELHRRAGSWYEREGWASEAVEHALSAGDHDWAADLVERVVGEMWFRGEVLTLLGWLVALPERAKRRRPRLLLEHATVLMWVGRLEGVESLVREAERIVEAGSGEGPASSAENTHRRYLLGYAAAARAWHANLTLEAMGYHAELQMARGRLREADGILRRALDFAAERGDGSLPASGEVHVATGELLYEWDDLAAAEDMLTQGIRLAERTGQIGSLVDGCVSLSRLKQAKGDTAGALETAREAQRLARSAGVDQFIVEAAAWRSRLHLTRGELAAATPGG